MRKFATYARYLRRFLSRRDPDASRKDTAQKLQLMRETVNQAITNLDRQLLTNFDRQLLDLERVVRNDRS